MKDALVKNFLKIETSVKPIDPRNISPRSDEFLSILGPYISSLEHSLIDHPAFVKGLDIDARDNKMQELMNFDYFIETDYTRFDMSVSLPIITDVQDFLLMHPFYGIDSYYLLQALQLARYTVGVNELGVSYSVHGTRCSGDAHTSVANTIINHFNTWFALRFIPADLWVSYHEGDDGVIACKRSVYNQVCYNLSVLPCLGFQVKASVHRSVDFITFCGRWYYAKFGRLKSTCDVIRTASKIHTTCHLGNPLALLIAKYLSYYHTDASTPIIGPFITMFLRLHMHRVTERQLRRAVSNMVRDYWFRVHSLGVDFSYKTKLRQYAEIDAEARSMVALRTGISPATQVQYEQYYISFERLGYIPECFDKLPGSWMFTLDSNYYGSIHDYVI